MHAHGQGTPSNNIVREVNYVTGRADSRRRDRRAAGYRGKKKLTHRKRAHTHAHSHTGTRTHAYTRARDYALPLRESVRYAKVPRSRIRISLHLRAAPRPTRHCFYHRLPLRPRSIVLDATLSPLRSFAQRKKRPWGYRLRASTAGRRGVSDGDSAKERRRDYDLRPRINLSIVRSLVSLERPAVISRARATRLTGQRNGEDARSGYYRLSCTWLTFPSRFRKCAIDSSVTRTSVLG